MAMQNNNTINNESNKNYDLLQQQIDELQSRLSHQEDLLHSLNDVIATQDAAIITLQHNLQQNQEKLADVAYNVESAAGIEKPPHY